MNLGTRVQQQAYTGGSEYPFLERSRTLFAVRRERGARLSRRQFKSMTSRSAFSQVILGIRSGWSHAQLQVTIAGGKSDNGKKDSEMKSILLYINRDAGQDSRLASAIEIVRATDGHLICLQATPWDAYFFVGDPFGGAYVPTDIFQTIREAEKEDRALIEGQLQREGIDWEWRHAEGSAAQAIAENAKLADLVVLSQPEHKESILPRRTPLAADVAVHIQSPTLVVPISDKRFDCGGAAMIAWNGSSESAHAVRLSLSLLRAATAVHVVGVSEDDENSSLTDISAYLTQHGIETQLHQQPRGDDSIADALIAAAAELDAEYILLGAYGHSRIRETVLGGVTQDLILESPVPLILAH